MKQIINNEGYNLPVRTLSVPCIGALYIIAYIFVYYTISYIFLFILYIVLTILYLNYMENDNSIPK